MSLGPLMVDLAGLELSAEERELLRHPAVGGVVLFSRNYESPAQIAALTAEIHGLRAPPLLVAVDQEGGRVQRLRAGFTRLPAPAVYGALHDRDEALALETAGTAGWVMAAELRAVGVDFSFAPVLDLGAGVSRVIGGRAFHRDPETAAALARAFVSGMRRAPMAAVGKHFPGHGSVAPDSHEELPVDGRDLETVRLEDMLVFERLIHAGIPALMTAHLVFPAVDEHPATYSKTWLRRVLRGELGFQGAVFSDDLGMAGAAAGGLLARARLALAAGCDVALLCNRPEEVPEVIDGIGEVRDPVRGSRLARLHGGPAPGWADLLDDPGHREAALRIGALEVEPELDLGDDTPM